MPQVEDASILSPVLELLHLNFRELRQNIEHKMAHLRVQVFSCADHLDSDGERLPALQNLSALRTELSAAKETHRRLVKILRARVQYWQQFDNSHDQKSRANPETQALEDLVELGEVDLPFVVQIANYLAERGCFESALAKLLEKRPEIKPLVDTDISAEEHQLVRDFEQSNVSAVLKWCRVHRSALKRGGSRLEFNLQLRKFQELARDGLATEALFFAQKAFSRSSPVDFAAITDSSAVLYGGVEEQGDTKPTREIAREIRQAVRQVYRRPQQSPLINNVLLGAAAMKTRRCAPGSLALPPVDHMLPRVCPLCRSKKQQALFDAVPYAQHTRSHLEADLRMFPSGVVFGLETITKFMAAHYPTLWARNEVIDPHTHAVIFIDELVPVYAL